MERIARSSDLSAAELQILRRIVAASFVGKRTVSQAHGDRLSALGLIHCAMGGLMPTSAGRIVSRF